ncbi:MAG: cupredoxin domain-containing protein [Thermoplasmatota archaeon]
MRGLAAGLVLALLLLAGCADNEGDDSGSSDTNTATGGVLAGAPKQADLAIASTGAYPANPGFDPTTASVPAGAIIHVTFTNGDLLPVQHNVIFEMMGGSDTIGSGEETRFDLKAPDTPGEFAFYCSVGDHRDRGMEGTLTVTA